MMRPGNPGPRPGGPAMRPGPSGPPMMRPVHYGPPPVMRPVYPPPPPRRYYYGGGWHDRYDRDWVGGALGVGLLLGTLLNNQAQVQAQNDAQAQQLAYDMKAANVQNAAMNTAATQSAQLVQILSQAGPQAALEDLNQYWHNQGQATFLDARQPISTLKVAGFEQNMTLTYTINSQTNTAVVTVSTPDYNVLQSSTVTYTPPPVFTPPETSKMLGFTLNDTDRTPQGFLIARQVAPATAAAYIGIKNNAVIYKIDGNSTAQVTAAQLNAYIRGRSANNAVVTVTFSANGKQKTGNIKP